MLGAIAGLPRQLTAGYAVARSGLSGVFGEAGAAAPAPPSRPTGVVVCGMGGVDLAADEVLGAQRLEQLGHGGAFLREQLEDQQRRDEAGIGVVAVSYTHLRAHETR